MTAPNAHLVKRFVAGALLSGGAALAELELGAGTAHAFNWASPDTMHRSFLAPMHDAAEPAKPSPF
jgi:hypothetical protein